MLTIDNLVRPVSAALVKRNGKPGQSKYGLLIPSNDPVFPFLPVILIVPGATKLEPVGSLVRAVGDVRPGRREDGSSLTIVSSLTEEIVKVASKIPIPSMTLGGPVKKVWFDAFGDVNLLINAGKEIAPWKVRVTLQSFTHDVQDIFLRLSDYPSDVVVSATVVYHRPQGRGVVFAAWSIDITYPDNPWLPLKPGVDPQLASTYEASDEFRSSPEGDLDEAAYPDSKGSERPAHGRTSL